MVFARVAMPNHVEVIKVRLKQTYPWFSLLPDTEQTRLASTNFSITLDHNLNKATNFFHPMDPKASFDAWLVDLDHDSSEAMQLVKALILKVRVDHALSRLTFIEVDRNRLKNNYGLSPVHQDLEMHLFFPWLKPLFMEKIKPIFRTPLPEDVMNTVVRDIMAVVINAPTLAELQDLDWHFNSLRAQLDNQRLFATDYSLACEEHGLTWSFVGFLQQLRQTIFMPEDEHLIRRLADAHVFFQFTGCTSQNGGIIFDILDIYNYLKYDIDAINRLSVLLRPLFPVYQEILAIAGQEKSTVFIFFRTLFLLTTFSVFFTLGYLAMASLVLPEIASLILLIPVLYASCGLTGAVMYAKNQGYIYARQWYWGGIDGMPEFQINTRMQHGFGSDAAAKAIRDVYLQAIKTCDALESKFSTLASQGLLTEDALIQRRENLAKKGDLYLEWYDIHSKHSILGVDKLPKIAAKRFIKEGEQEHKALKKAGHDYLRALRFYKPMSEQAMHLKMSCEMHQRKLDELSAYAIPSYN